MARISSYGLPSTDRYEAARAKEAEGEKKEIWSSLLDGASSEKRLPQKTVLVLGGTAETQKDFLDSLNPELAKKRERDPKRAPPIAHQFALGYTYQDVVDTEHDGMIDINYTMLL
jgi:dynein light intermediate chain 1, cytosolic